MLLAGFIGSVLITFMPLTSLADALPSTGRLSVLLAMGGVALIGMLLPVPISFDVIVTAILWNAGLPVQYAMVLLFTLGIFSVFPFFVIWQTIGLRIAATLFLVLAALGIAAGILAKNYFEWDSQRQQALFFDVFGKSPASLQGPKMLRAGGDNLEQKSDVEIVSRLQSARLVPQPVRIAGADGIAVQRMPFQVTRGDALLLTNDQIRRYARRLPPI